jgi:hypothetical protein
MILSKRLSTVYDPGPDVEIAIFTNDSGNFGASPADLFVGVLPGDQLVLIAATDAGFDPDPGSISGWTQRNFNQTTTNTGCVYTRIADGSDTFATTTLTSVDWDAAIIGVLKIRTHTFFGALQANNTSGTPDPPNIVGMVSGNYSLIFGYLDDQSVSMVPAGGLYTGADGSYLTTNITAGSGDQGSGLIGIREHSGASGFDPGAFTGGVSDGWIAYHVRLT